VRKPPGDEILSIKGQIFHPIVIGISLEARVLLLRQFLAHSDCYSLPDEFPVCWLPCFSEIADFANLSVHASDLPSSSDHVYFMLFACIPVTIHEI
jgi:hypothetical protein